MSQEGDRLRAQAKAAREMADAALRGRQTFLEFEFELLHAADEADARTVDQPQPRPA